MADTDTIYRQAAIDVLNKLARANFTLKEAFSFYLGALHDASDGIKELPSALVRCRDCQWYSEEHRLCTEHGIEDRDGSGYCSDGVQREGGVDE